MKIEYHPEVRITRVTPPEEADGYYRLHFDKSYTMSLSLSHGISKMWCHYCNRIWKSEIQPNASDDAVKQVGVNAWGQDAGRLQIWGMTVETLPVIAPELVRLVSTTNERVNAKIDELNAQPDYDLKEHVDTVIETIKF